MNNRILVTIQYGESNLGKYKLIRKTNVGQLKSFLAQSFNIANDFDLITDKNDRLTDVDTLEDFNLVDFSILRIVE